MRERCGQSLWISGERAQTMACELECQLKGRGGLRVILSIPEYDRSTEEMKNRGERLSNSVLAKEELLSLGAVAEAQGLQAHEQP